VIIKSIQTAAACLNPTDKSYTHTVGRFQTQIPY